MDRISNLPNDIIFHIVSLLSAKDAARTKVVSKNWLNKITIIPDLVLDHSVYICGKFSISIDQLLAQHISFRIRRFSLRLNYVDLSQCNNLVKDCLCNVMNRGVLDIELEGDYSLPLELFTCKTVVKLKLGSGFVIDDLPENASLPFLKTLVLDSVRFDSSNGGCVFTKLMSACPVLEELVIDGFNWEHWKWSRVISSLTLKRLIIRRDQWPEEWGHEYPERLSFDTPSLAYLEYKDIIPFMYPSVSFNSLVEARLDLSHCDYTIDLTNLFKGLKNVRILRLENVDLVDVFHDEALPVFENMSHLSIATEKDFCWQPLKLLVTKSPNLKTLTIQELHHRYLYCVCGCLSEYSFLMSCGIEVVKITKFKGDHAEMVQIKHILEKLPCLELLEVHVQTGGDDYKQETINDRLQMLARATSKLGKLKVKFS